MRRARGIFQHYSTFVQAAGTRFLFASWLPLSYLRSRELVQMLGRRNPDSLLLVVGSSLLLLAAGIPLAAGPLFLSSGPPAGGRGLPAQWGWTSFSVLVACSAAGPAIFSSVVRLLQIRKINLYAAILRKILWAKPIFGSPGRSYIGSTGIPKVKGRQVANDHCPGEVLGRSVWLSSW
jgi:hypothetical protein